MSTSRTRLWLVTVAVLVAIAAGGWFALTWEADHPLGQRSYQRIVPGMTRAEVEAILGGPAGVVGQAPEYPAFVELVEQDGPVNAQGGLEGKFAIWFSDRGQIVVTFDSWGPSGRVVGKQLYRPARRR